jgi:hypothetical protein
MSARKANNSRVIYDLGFLPKSGKMLLIAGNQLVRTRRIGAFEKHIIIRVAGDFKAAHCKPMSAPADEPTTA